MRIKKKLSKSRHLKRGTVSINCQIISRNIFVFSPIADEYLSHTIVSSAIGIISR